MSSIFLLTLNWWLLALHTLFTWRCEIARWNTKLTHSLKHFIIGRVYNLYKASKWNEFQGGCFSCIFSHFCCLGMFLCWGSSILICKRGMLRHLLLWRLLRNILMSLLILRWLWKSKISHYHIPMFIHCNVIIFIFSNDRFASKCLS